VKDKGELGPKAQLETKEVADAKQGMQSPAPSASFPEITGSVVRKPVSLPKTQSI